MQLECYTIHLVGFSPHHISPVLHMFFSLSLSQLFEGVEFFGEGVCSARLFNLELGLGHLRGLLQRNREIIKDSQTKYEKISIYQLQISSIELTSKCLLI